MATKEILLLGNPKLYDISDIVYHDEIDYIKDVVNDLHDTLFDFRNKYGYGRGIAAPQIGIMKRLIYIYVEKPIVIINPSLSTKSEKKVRIWDDCMCFPDLLVKVERYKICKITFKDLNWNENSLDLDNNLSLLIQHEYDHLDGILATFRAINPKSFALRSQKNFLA
jgi:peptide deformylase